MIQTFADRGTGDIYNGKNIKVARKTCPPGLWRLAVRKMDMVNFAGGVLDLLIPPGNRLEALKGDRAGQYSIRINAQYRICFTWTDSGPADVEIDDYHK